MRARLKNLTRRQRTILLVGLLIGVALIAAVSYTGQPQEIRKEGNALRDAETGQELGVARKEKDGNIWRVFSTVRLPELTEERAYHGWLTEPLSGQTYYVGEFFAVQDGYSLTYSTEDDLRFFTAFQVSRETAEIPNEPSNNIAIWDFEVVLPSPTPLEPTI